MSTEPTHLAPPVQASPISMSGAAGDAMGERGQLTLTPSRKFPRRLVLRLRLREMYVFLYGPSRHADPGPPIAYASACIDDCHLGVRETRCDLWLGRASFDLSPQELERVRAFVAPLCIREQEIP